LFKYCYLDFRGHWALPRLKRYISNSISYLCVVSAIMDASALSPEIEMNIPEDNANVEPPPDPVTGHRVESGPAGSESPPDAAADAESPPDAEGDPKDDPDAEGDPEDAPDAPDDRAATPDVPMEIEALRDAPMDPEPPMEPGVPNLSGSSDDSLSELTDPCSSPDQDVRMMGSWS
jgi:hypothetical protein